jgi:formylglycine-generating enzyme required for sulfatase activity
VARIFLCHASEDKTPVREVYRRLRDNGFQPWLDEKDLIGGQQWEQEIPVALQASDFILIFFSQNSIRKIGYVQNEFKLALEAWRRTPEGMIRTIPVRLDDCEVPREFRRFHWIDLFDEGGFERIIRAIHVGVSQRQPPLAPRLTNSIGMEFVQIPAGTFLMGSPDSDREAEADEKPAHRVAISKPFYLGKYPVTQLQWETVMDYNPSKFKRPSCPVESVSWYDVHDFLRILNEQEGSGNYRLPTEAEWEYACRAGTETSRYHPDINAIAWYEGDSIRGPQRVGQKVPNAWGLYDMLGNVFEWCHDGERKYTTDAVVDPIEPTGDHDKRSIRGGGWSAPAQLVRAAGRLGDRPNFVNVALGFRCASSGPSQ